MSTSINRLIQILFLIGALSLFLNAETFTRILNPERFSPSMSDFFLKLPYLLLLAGALIGWNFNKSQVTFINLALAAGYFIAVEAVGKSDLFRNRLLFEPFFACLTVLLCLNILVFFLGRERGILTRAGIVKLLLLVSGFGGFLCLFLGSQETILNFLKEYPVFSQKAIWLNTNLIATAVTIFTALTLIVLQIRTQNPTGRFLSFTVVLLFLALNFDKPWAGGKICLYRTALIFSINALTMLFCLYFLTWGRVFSDQLTGLLNRRALDEALQKLSGEYSVCMLDIDFFKSFNDTFGHQAGDEVLKFVAESVKNCGFGTGYRYGGEEFVIVTPGQGITDVVNEAEALRRKIESGSLMLTQVKNPKYYGKRVSLTVSIGISQSTDFSSEPDEVLQSADAALYRAKKKGRNRVEMEKRKVRR
ncbi:MAG: GGDEF domain-containing protein [Candidatus Wallbacteria bacterium]|nr:GGDEF domain-containing protein [Candidatus Wallbacteria bacterium]